MADKFRIATVTTQNGCQWTTEANGTDQSLCNYFLGKEFNTADYPKEILSTAISISIDGKKYNLANRTPIN